MPCSSPPRYRIPIPPLIPPTPHTLRLTPPPPLFHSQDSCVLICDGVISVYSSLLHPLPCVSGALQRSVNTPFNTNTPSHTNTPFYTNTPSHHSCFLCHVFLARFSGQSTHPFIPTHPFISTPYFSLVYFYLFITSLPPINSLSDITPID